MSTMALRSVLARYREEIGPQGLPGQEDVLKGASSELDKLEALVGACRDFIDAHDHVAYLGSTHLVLERRYEDLEVTT